MPSVNTKDLQYTANLWYISRTGRPVETLPENIPKDVGVDGSSTPLAA